MNVSFRRPWMFARTMRFRIALSLGVFLILALVGVSLALSTRSARDDLLAAFSSTWNSAQAAARLDYCVSNLHRQATLLAQGYAGDENEAVSPEVRGSFGKGIGECQSELALLRVMPEQQAIADATSVLARLKAVVDKLGLDHVEAIRLLAMEVDPVAETLTSQGFPEMRARLGDELERLQGEIGALGRRGDQTLLIALVGPVIAFALIAGFLLRRVLQSLNSLSVAMRAFGSGQLSHRVSVGGADEFSVVANQINTMAGELAANQRELTNYAHELELSLVSLKEAQRAAVERQKLAALGELVAGVAHEVNTPLGVAVTSASLAREYITELQTASDNGTCTRGMLRRVTGALTEVVRPLEENLARAARLIRSFKQVAVDRATVTSRLVRLDQWAQAVGLSLAPVTRHHGVTVVFDVPPIPLRIAAGELEQILTNIILNACVHAFPEPTADQGALTRTVEVQARVDLASASGRFVLLVRDNGVGMTDEVASRVYEPFFTTKRGQGGSGLGMHIVHQLVHERFEGEIALETSPGRGTTWTLTLAVPTDALLPVHQEDAQEESPETIVVTNGAANPPR